MNAANLNQDKLASALGLGSIFTLLGLGLAFVPASLSVLGTITIAIALTEAYNRR